MESLRQIARSGDLTESNVWALANILNNDDKQRSSWPGSQLFQLCRDAYGDGQISEDEILTIRKFIVDATESLEELEADRLLGLLSLPALGFTRLVLPGVDPQAEDSATGKETPDVYHRRKFTCTCADWRISREQLPKHSPGRLCVHQTRLVSRREQRLALHPALRTVVGYCIRNDLPMIAEENWGVLAANSIRFVVAWGAGDTIHFYALGPQNRVSTFSFDRNKNDWSLGTRRDYQALLVPFVDCLAESEGSSPTQRCSGLTAFSLGDPGVSGKSKDRLQF